jgi:hypothetical protein
MFEKGGIVSAKMCPSMYFFFFCLQHETQTKNEVQELPA